jgi:L-asparagine transporter-like permease
VHFAFTRYSFELRLGRTGQVRQASARKLAGAVILAALLLSALAAAAFAALAAAAARSTAALALATALATLVLVLIWHLILLCQYQKANTRCNALFRVTPTQNCGLLML